MFTGAMVALVTPFKNGGIDEARLKILIDDMIAGGIDAIVPCGTTGESATLSHAEHERIVDLTVRYVNKRVAVIAGTGSNSTREAIALTRHAQGAGADAALLITPYYNKPTQEGLIAHFTAVAEAVDVPLILYNVPGRTAVNMLPETVARLATVPHIVGIKEASGSVAQITELIAQVPEEFVVLSGDDPLTWPLLACGARGVISVTANVVPHDVAALWDHFVAGDYKACYALHYKMLPLTQALFVATNPIPVKAALALLGKIGPEIRLPLTPLAGPALERLKAALVAYGLLAPGP